MAKPGLTLGKIDNALGSTASNSSWALCVGAGTSLGPFPSWQNLVARIASSDEKVADPEDFIAELARVYSLDSIIEAACDRLGLSESDYLSFLAQKLYEDFIDAAGDRWSACSSALAAGYPGKVEASHWDTLLSVVRNSFPNVSAIPLASFVIDAVEFGLRPSAIITFNAEPLLFALLNALNMERARIAGREVSASPTARMYDRMVHSVSNHRNDRVPYFFCHGLLPIPGADQRLFDYSPDKIVFAEHEYLQLANNAFSWQSANFLNVCMSSCIVFVGLSLSDSNIRRWLSWVQSHRLNDLRYRKVDPKESSRHFWIEKDPGSSAKKLWLESLVAKLGIRVVWIPGWDALDAALRELLNLRGARPLA